MERIKKATRQSFGEAISNLKNKNIVVLDADVDSSTKTSLFREKHPERFIENGIAEADMVSTAAGLATCDMIPIVSTFAAFATGRCYDQIRTSIAYPNLNVKICGTHAGITVGEDGATHQMLEDINLMRGLPNMVVLSPADDISTKKCIKEMIKYNGPVYLRLSRAKTDVIYAEDIDFKIGKGHQMGEGKDITIFSCGDVLEEVLKAAEMLERQGLEVRVCDMYSIKPIDKELIIKSAKETGMLFSVEDHSVIGGLGTAISEVLIDYYPKKLTRIGISDKFGISGRQDELLKYFKLDANSIVARIFDQMKKTI